MNNNFKKINIMEDYEKKYKQLHKFITDLYPHMSEYCKEKVEGFFPELKESEDERVRKAILSTIKSQGFISDEETLRQCVAWLEKQAKQNPAWSEEDETFTRDAVAAAEEYYTKGCGQEELVVWLKSLKDKYTWKPSKAQLRVLQTAIKDYGICVEKNVLESLYNDLLTIVG